MMKAVRTGACLVALTALIAANASAQAPTQPTSSDPAKAKKKKYKRNPVQFVRRSLDRLPDLPYMPSWPGQYKLQDAAASINPKGGPAFHVQMTSPDTPDQILNYYQRGLSANNWKISKQNQINLSATHDYNTISLYVLPSRLPKMKSSIMMLYSECNVDPHKESNDQDKHQDKGASR